MHISPIELDQMEFYRIEYLLKNFEEALDEEEKQYKSKQKEYEKQYKQYSPSTIKQPSFSGSDYGGFKVPKIEVPKITPPKIKI